MIAVRYSNLTLQDSTAFQWLDRFIKNVTVLPANFDALLDQAAFDQFLVDNQANYTTYKAEQAAAQALAGGAGKFKQVREKWQDISDEFAASNVGSSITTAEAVVLADNFENVEKYLRLNVPMKALAEIDLVPTDATFLTVAKRDAMKAQLLGHIQEIFEIPS